MSRRQVFRGHIAGVGTSSGTRVVVGWWYSSPLGTFADAMLETPSGHRVLLAPTPDVARFVAQTYTFDETRVEPFEVTGDPDSHWQVRSASLQLSVQVGPLTALGRVLRLLPTRLATAPWWCTLTDPVARVVLRGVRTAGTAGRGRKEYYGATALRTVTAASGTFEGADLGALAPLHPPVRFGFGSAPTAPSVTTLTTTVVLPGPVVEPT